MIIEVPINFHDKINVYDPIIYNNKGYLVTYKYESSHNKMQKNYLKIEDPNEYLGRKYKKLVGDE
jgi:uncharacterized protein YxeA